ncbi:MAG TPA: hypothetical protein VN673_07110 [Clostridia bacterium]|nr:hypothetical protein [Clostridia bacterium]
MITQITNDPKNSLATIQQHMNGTVENAADRACAIGHIWRNERDALLSVMNATTNTIDASLKRIAILNESVRAFARRAILLSRFSTVFGRVPLQGTDEVTVRYYPLQAAASRDFVAANGYVFDNNSSTLAKKIKVDKRKYQTLDYSSEDFARQPFFDTVRLGIMNAEKLAYDVLLDIFSIVTIAKYGEAVKSLDPAAWTSDDVIDVRKACNDAHWPEEFGRSLVVNTDLDTALQKDPAYKLALNSGGTQTIREGQLPRISGFDYGYMPGFPENGENLIGIAAFASAILTAMSPVAPAPGVRRQLVAYDVAVDTETGISMNYRHWGDALADRDYEVIECAYGFEAGEPQAIKRLAKP